MKRRCLYILFSLVVFCVLGLCSYANGYALNASLIASDLSSDTVYTGVSAISGGRIVVSMDNPSLGRVLRIYDVTELLQN